MPNPTTPVANLDPYEVSESATLSNEEKGNHLKLDWNESTFPTPPAVIEAIRRVLAEGHLEYYPDVNARRLRESLSEYVGVDAQNIQVFNGSDAALRNIFDAYIEPGDKVLIREPVYTQPYTFVHTNGGEIINFTASSPFADGVDEYGHYLEKSGCKVTYHPNPNNPTGVCYKPSTVSSLLRRFSDTLFIIDEAYYEFTGVSVADKIREHENLIVTRTFSKAFALAGIRVGYIVASPAVMREINKIRNGKSVGLLGQIAATAALENTDHMEKIVEEVEQARAWMVNRLQEEGMAFHKTPANFILIKVGDAPAVVNRLQEFQILVRDRSYLPQLDDYIRVTIGSKDQMKQFLEAFLSLEEHLLCHTQLERT